MTTMKIKGKISILINRDYTSIELEDDNARTTFVKVKMTPELLSMALSRQAYIDCEMEVNHLDRVGKKHENKSFEFEISKSLANSDFSDSLQNIAQSQLKEGWIAENYFGSQNSFFTKDNKQFARCTIRRWI